MPPDICVSADIAVGIIAALPAFENVLRIDTVFVDKEQQLEASVNQIAV